MIRIDYEDISLSAKSDSTITCTDKQSFSNLNLLKQDNVEYKKFATLEENLWLLDGSFKNFPDTPANENFALWSSQMSDSNGEFDTPIEVEISFSSYKSCVGLMLDFSNETNDYPNSMTIKWYQNSTLLSEKNFLLNKSQFFCENSVELFNKIVITIDSMNKPYRYLKFENIVYGIIRVFEEDKIRSINLLEDVSITSEELKINTLEFTLNNKDLINFIFQQKQPLAVYRNNQLLGTFFIDSAKRKSQTIYEISAFDYIGILDRMSFTGRTYSNALVSTIIADIMGDIPYTLASSLSNYTLSGTLETCTRREALLQVAFAICAVVDTSRSNKVNIFPATLQSNSSSSTISNGIYTGVNFINEDIITEIRLNLNNGTQITKKNSILPSDVLDNIIEFSGVFIDSSNAQRVLNYLYDYYIANGNAKTNMKFIVANNQKLGDVVSFVTEYLGNKSGIITQMKFNLNSSKLVAQAIIKNIS